MYFFVFLFLFFLTSCNNDQDAYNFFSNNDNVQGEYIYRKSNERFIELLPPQKRPIPTYPWNEERNYELPLITKEYFRCKGSGCNEIQEVNLNGELTKLIDCDGSSSHGLPLQNGKEFIYPILIDLLNYIQKSTKQKVIVTSGHRCPEHNTYIDPENFDPFSKHMIGAEVSFYVTNFENDPIKIIHLIKDFYSSSKLGFDFSNFHRYDKEKCHISTDPWYNKEIFVKLFQKNEGRNKDNNHPYPYISIQVKYDKEKNEKVIYTWNKANRQYLRK